MNTFPQSASRPRRLSDYGAFQTDIAMLDTLSTTAIQQQDRLTEALSSDNIHKAGLARNRFPALTLPSRKPLQQRRGIRAAFLLCTQKIIAYKWSALIFRLFMTVVLLVYLFKSLSWQTLLLALVQVHPGNLLVGLVVGGSGIVLSAYQWRVLLRAQHIYCDLADLIKLYLTGITISHFLPTGFGGDTFKSFYVGRTSRNGVGATTATLMCRVTGFISMIFLIFPVLILLHQQVPFILFLVFMLLCLLGGAVIVGIFLSGFLLPRLPKNRWTRHHFFTRLANVGTAMYKSALKLYSSFHAILYGGAFWLVAILNCYVYANALGIHIQIAFYFLMVPFAAIIASLPISLNGFGLREGAFVYILSFAHVTSATALLLVLVLDLQALFFALIGGCLYFALGNKKKRCLLREIIDLNRVYDAST